MARVVDLTGHAAAYCGRLLAEMGHDVIRVEPRRGDALRWLEPFLGGVPDPERGAYHHFLNAGKRSFTPDLDSDAGRKLLLELVATADTLVAHLPLPVSERDLVAAKEDLIVVRVDDSLPELCAYARSGLLAVTGHPGETPVLLGGHAPYAYVGTFVAIAVLAGLLAGRGQLIDMSATGCLEVLGEQGVVATEIGEPFERRGYRGAATAISGAFRCADGLAMLSVAPNAAGWLRFMEWVQDPVLQADGLLADEGERRAKKDFVIGRVEEWTSHFPKEELVEEAQRRHIPSAPITTPLDLVQNPQLVERGFLRTVAYPALGEMAFPVGAMATMRGSQPPLAPRLGQNNREILGELGYSADEQERLLEAGTV
jgi:crotonobetainyl-CoA:carnitine CoA-transferase CaiB-like acyl-CoA transferase